ncbi:MAG: elongation factor G [Opitutaceae bacterium]|nr:elongation factor G [Opitutaceae bacterium]|tara:strand:- start:4719 stop:6779 length:2061 start_codon:yes stop_codon:yes gene_type:complete
MSYTAEHIRNFAVVGHQGAGKTILSEAMLATAGAIKRMGSIEAGNTVSDYHPSEKERQMSVHASLLNCTWMENKFNIIDTPGYFDFISEGLGALRVGDFALVVIDAMDGPQLGTDQVWEYAKRYDIPKMIVINGCDKENVDFDSVFATVQDHFGNNVFPMTLPLNPGPGFTQILDVLRSEEIYYNSNGSGKFSEKAAEGENAERVEELHSQLVEFVAEADDSLLERFFEEGNLSEEELRGGIHKAIQEGVFVPAYVTSANLNVGISRLMDMISKYGSSPVDRKEVPVEDNGTKDATIDLDDKSPSCYIWKTISEPHVGELSFCRMYSGSIKPGIEMHNTNRNVNEKIGQIFTLQGHDRESIDIIGPGDIGVMAKLRDTHTGNTLTSPDRKIKLPKVTYPKPNIHATLVVANRGDEEKLAEGLNVLHEEDPTFLYDHNQETNELVLSGQGELHLDVIKSRLKNRFKVEINLVQPRVAFRETIRKPAESKYRHKKQSGGAGQFAEVWMRIKPGVRDSGIDFKESLVGQNVDRVFVPSVEKGINAAVKEGILAGYFVTDLAIDFYDGKMHPVDSKDIAFQIAGKEAFREAFRAAQPCLLEPIMQLEIRVPEAYVGDVMGDLSSIRGRIQGIEVEGKYQVVKAQAPEMELYRYATKLRSMTGGSGVHSEEFSHYEYAPPDVEAKVVAASN